MNREQIRQRLREIVSAQNKSLRTLSMAMGKNESYLRDFVNKGSPQELGERERKRLANLLNIDERLLIADEDSFGLNDPSLSYDDQSVVASRDNRATVQPGQIGGYFEELTLRVPVIGEVKAGVWMEATQLPESEWTYMMLPADLRYPGVRRVAFRLGGDSMNKMFPDGATLVSVLLADIEEEPKPDWIVIVERERKDGLVEATCKRFVIEDGKAILKPESTNPKHQPIPMSGDKSIAEIRIIARVTDAVTRVA